jgi:arabinofuranosyltransferase
VIQATAVDTRRDYRRAAWVVCIAVPLVVLAIGAWHYRWMSDDGFINLRVVRQIQAGHGPVFNQGERVEASTSPLWVAVLTVADVVLPLRLEWIAVLLGIACTLAGTALIVYGNRDVIRLRANDFPVPTGIWVLVAIAPTWKFASSGLENGLFTLWFGASFALLARWAARDDAASPGIPTAIAVGLGPLIRPDLALFSAAFLVAVIVVARSHRIRFLAAALAMPVVFQLFRMGYYDEFTPNTALAKEASRSWWSNGWHYLRVAGQPYWVWIPLLALAVGAYVPLWRDADGRRRVVVIACVAAGIVHLLFVARVGGDFMHARMALPGLTALVAPVAVTPVTRTATRLVMPAVVIAWALVSIAFLRSKEDAPVTFIGTPRNAVTLADYGWQKDGPNRRWFTGEGVYFGETPVDAPARPGLPRATVASFGVGIGSYALGPDVYVLDMLGLGDTFTAHLRLDHRGVIAHEKPLPKPWVAARLIDPNASVRENQFPTPPFFIAKPLDHPVGTFDERVDAARRALDCGRLRALLDRADEPLTFGRFVGNLFHSFGDTRLRVAPEPADAVRQFCGR